MQGKARKIEVEDCIEYNHLMEFEQEKTSWCDLIRTERESAGHSMITWEVVAEGAIVSVSKGPSCAGVWVYMFGGPEEDEDMRKLPYMWFSGYESEKFPQLKMYHSCPPKGEYEEINQNPEPWIEEGKSFVEAIRNLPRE